MTQSHTSGVGMLNLKRNSLGTSSNPRSEDGTSECVLGCVLLFHEGGNLPCKFRESVHVDMYYPKAGAETETNTFVKGKFPR